MRSEHRIDLTESTLRDKTPDERDNKKLYLLFS